MLRLGGRAIRFVALIGLVSIAAFALQVLLPGDASTIPVSQASGPVEAAQIRAELGVDAAAPIRFVRWATRAGRGDFGTSTATGEAVRAALWRAARVTIELAVLAQLVGVIAGFALAIAAATQIGSRLDSLIRALSFGLLAVPAFAVAALLLAIFAVRLHWLPAAGYLPPTQSLSDNLRSMVLPALTLGLPIGAVLARVLRADLVANLSSDHAVLCRAMGFSPRRIVILHALRVSAINVTSVIGLDFARLLGGTLVVEQLYALPGLGRLAITSVGRRDEPVIQALVLLAGVAFLFTSMIADLGHRRLDPRLRASVVSP
jgi:peptide/nickel transport system permease protein